MPIEVGDKLPEATFKVRTSDGLGDVTTHELAAGKKIVLFAVPGAFTPSCHNQHLPSYLEHHDALKEKGIETIACVAVNDAFVLGAWGDESRTGDKVVLLSDGNADFTRAIGMDFDGSGFGLGTRSKRYAMIVEDGVVKHLAVEDAPPQVDASKADKLLAAL